MDVQIAAGTFGGTTARPPELSFSQWSALKRRNYHVMRNQFAMFIPMTWETWQVVTMQVHQQQQSAASHQRSRSAAGSTDNSAFNNSNRRPTIPTFTSERTPSTTRTSSRGDQSKVTKCRARSVRRPPRDAAAALANAIARGEPPGQHLLRQFSAHRRSRSTYHATSLDRARIERSQSTVRNAAVDSTTHRYGALLDPHFANDEFEMRGRR